MSMTRNDAPCINQSPHIIDLTTTQTALSKNIKINISKKVVSQNILSKNSVINSIKISIPIRMLLGSNISLTSGEIVNSSLIEILTYIRSKISIKNTVLAKASDIAISSTSIQYQNIIDAIIFLISNAHTDISIESELTVDAYLNYQIRLNSNISKNNTITAEISSIAEPKDVNSLIDIVLEVSANMLLVYVYDFEGNIIVNQNIDSSVDMLLPISSSISVANLIENSADIEYIWDVYNATPYYDFQTETVKLTKTQLHDSPYNCNGADSRSEYEYSIDHSTGAITFVVSSYGWKWSYISHLYAGWGVWPTYGTGTTHPSVFFINETGETQDSPYTLTKYTSGITNYTNSGVFVNTIYDANINAYPENGYDENTNLWYVKR